MRGDKLIGAMFLVFWALSAAFSVGVTVFILWLAYRLVTGLVG